MGLDLSSNMMGMFCAFLVIGCAWIPGTVSF
jgi:hypothetical protein